MYQPSVDNVADELAILASQARAVIQRPTRALPYPVPPYPSALPYSSVYPAVLPYSADHHRPLPYQLNHRAQPPTFSPLDRQQPLNAPYIVSSPSPSPPPTASVMKKIEKTQKTQQQMLQQQQLLQQQLMRQQQMMHAQQQQQMQQPFQPPSVSLLERSAMVSSPPSYVFGDHVLNPPNRSRQQPPRKSVFTRLGGFQHPKRGPKHRYSAPYKKKEMSPVRPSTSKNNDEEKVKNKNSRRGNHSSRHHDRA